MNTVFHPLIVRWFHQQVGKPTSVQEQAWPLISAGSHVLVTAPTGSGKTLAAFLWALNQLVTGRWETGRTSVLYVSPLRALNNDIRRNLLRPLAELRQVFEEAGERYPRISPLTRSGDTPQADRRRMLLHPPEILITTPESLNLLLSSPGGRSILGSLRTVILDEIHAVFGTKRGTHLITAVDRLVPLSGEFQRIALSATIRPADEVAAFVGGYSLANGDGEPSYEPRTVSIVSDSTEKRYQVTIRFPEEALSLDPDESLWDILVPEFAKILESNRSTLLFTNSRRMAEKLTLKINSHRDELVAYAHHGSLSREIRTEVEQRLKAGELKAIVATSSLELGIDIGELDEVILIQSPASMSSAIQRIGRAGHRVGVASRGTIFPSHSQDLLESAVLLRGIVEHDIEATAPIRNPLDVLAQVILSMTSVETWDIDELYYRLKTSYPYQELSRSQFDLVLNMLCGRYAESRIRELRPRLSVDRLDNTVAARKGSRLALYSSGGTIPDRGYFHLRHHETSAHIGELDEEFVWEASIGQSFTLGTQNWRIERITHNDVFVTPVPAKITATPFWKAEERNRDFHFSQRIATFLESANEHLYDPDLATSLAEKNFMEPFAAERLVGFLKDQKEALKGDLPHRHNIVVELVASGPGGVPGTQVVIHTIWGGRVNRPYALALDAAWEDRFGYRPRVYVSNDCIVLLLPDDVTGDTLLSLVTASNVEPLLRKRLEGSGFFGARFREAAARALLISRNRFSERLPLWMSRLRSQKLFNAVKRYDDFPILLETWRTCLRDEFDMENLRGVLAEVESGAIRWSEARTSYPSPMARTIAWRQTNEYMYMGDEPQVDTTSRLRGDLIEEVISSPALRPTIPREIVERFELKRQRLYPGYAPSAATELLDWIKERVVMPNSEFRTVRQAMEREHGLRTSDILSELTQKAVRVTPESAPEDLIVALERLPQVRAGFYPDGAKVDPLIPGPAPQAPKELEDELVGKERDELLLALLAEWLQFYGPVTSSFIVATLGIQDVLVHQALGDLGDTGSILIGELVTDETETQVCDTQNFESLLRIARRAAVPQVEPLPLEQLPLFLATYQGLAGRGTGVEDLGRYMEQLLCYGMPAEMWETEVLPARLAPYSLASLDALLTESELRWVGKEPKNVVFSANSDLPLLREEMGSFAYPAEETDGNGSTSPEAPEADDSIAALFTDPAAKYDFSTLVTVSKQSPSELTEMLWRGVWNGEVSNDTMAALRRGIQNKFRLAGVGDQSVSLRRQRTHGSRARFRKWQGSLPSAGSWFLVPQIDVDDDPLEREERNRDRVRVLLDRYGILFRELVAREMSAFRWSNIFRSLRIMELSGEVLSGMFFHGIPGLQFISHHAFYLLQRKLPGGAVFWINATDPASCAGLDVDELKGTLPKRLAGNHLVYHGSELVLISERNGERLSFQAPPDDPRMQEYLSLFRHLLTREFQPKRRIRIKTINDTDAATSPYVDPFHTSFEVVRDAKNILLYRSYATP